MTAGKTPTLHVLRSILRHIRSAPKVDMPKPKLSTTSIISPTNPLPESRNPLYEHVLGQYRANRSASLAQAGMLRKMAYDFSILKKDLSERGELHKLDGGAEVKLSPKEMSRLSARRAGLELPETYEG
eukprot:scaffold3351_cov192-Chaetoceros_neogracile.AAC.3